MFRVCVGLMLGFLFLIFRPLMVRILSFLIVCVVLLRFPLCVFFFVFPFRVLVRCLGCSVLLGSWCWESVVLECIGVFVVIGDLFGASIIVGFLRCCIWVFVVLGFLWWSPCSSQKVTRFLILGLILLLPFVSLVFFSGVGVSWYCGFLSSYWVFVLGFLLGFCFWVGGVCHFRWPCRYLPTRSEMLVIMVFSVLAFFLSGRCGLVSLGDRSREYWGRSRFCGLSRLVWRDWFCDVSLLGDRSRECWGAVPVLWSVTAGVAILVFL